MQRSRGEELGARSSEEQSGGLGTKPRSKRAKKRCGRVSPKPNVW